MDIIVQFSLRTFDVQRGGGMFQQNRYENLVLIDV